MSYIQDSRLALSIGPLFGLSATLLENRLGQFGSIDS